MKSIATGLLGAAALVYIGATAFEDRYSWLLYVSATAEAAMIGALADWFAVTALFRHPLGLRVIPHTAVIPRNKARIAAGLAQFVEQNFLSAAAVAGRIADLRPARALSSWVAKPSNADALARYAVRLLGFSLAALDDARLQRVLHDALVRRARRADVAAGLAQVLALLTENGRHHALVDEALAALDDLLAREDTQRFIAEEVARNAPRLKQIGDMFLLRIDEMVAVRIVRATMRKIAEVRADGQHPLRRRLDEAVARFIERLGSDEELRGRVGRLRDELLDSPALAEYVGGLWAELRDWLAADLHDDECSTVRRRAAALLLELGERLGADEAMQQWIDARILGAVPSLVEEHRAQIGRFIEDQINAWQEARLVEELERHVGDDLQYIRINGTVVGGLAGLLIAGVTQLLRG